MFRVQKKLERHFIYRGWALARALAYGAAVFWFLRALIPAALRSDFSTFGPQIGQLGLGFGLWLAFEFVVEKAFTWQSRPKKKKADPKAAKARKLPPMRVFYRRLSLAHLIPGRPNPVLVGLSEQDMEYVLPFRLYLSFRYLLYVAVGLITLMVIAADPVAHKIWPGEGYLGTLVPFFLIRAVESALLYLFLGSVMSGEDINGAKTTRFFAFEPTASFSKRLTLPILDRKAWLVSLHPFGNRWPKIIWWAVRIALIVITVMVAEAAGSLNIGYPRLITHALTWLMPLSVIYFATAFERMVGYLAFFPAVKKKKKAEDTATKTVNYQKLG